MADDYPYDERSMGEDKASLKFSRNKEFTPANGIIEGVTENDEAFQVPYDEEREGPRCREGINPEIMKEIIKRKITAQKQAYEQRKLIGGLLGIGGSFLGGLVSYELRKHGAHNPGYENLGTIIFTLATTTPAIGFLIGNYVQTKKILKDLRSNLSDLEK